MTPVNQFHSGTAVGDAITNEMLQWRSYLRALGHPSDIFAQHIPDALADEIIDIGRYRPSPSSVLLLHHSMGHDILDSVLAHSHRVVTVYHNITPVEFIDHPLVRHFARLGHDMLVTLAERSAGAIADSNYNRREMLRAGFDSARVIPVRTDFTGVRVARKVPRTRDWLFVGRVFPSKGQAELVDLFADAVAQNDFGGDLVLVGDTSDETYASEVRARADRRGIGGRVRLAGKVSDQQLADAYATAGLFASASQHEGFGVPLLEAMSAGLPVVAFEAGAIAETMAGAGTLIGRRDDARFVEACNAVLADPTVAAQVVERQRARIASLERFDVSAALATSVAEAIATEPRRLTVQIQGPFETSYSLATMNRQLALALDDNGAFDVSISATEGPGDYVPAESDLAAHPDATDLYRRGAAVPSPDIVIRQMFPPRVADSPGGLNLQYFAWEESMLPPEHVSDFNRHLDGIGVVSEYVKRVLEESGVNVPIHVVGNGVRLPDLANAEIPVELGTARSFRFLHISSAFPRKGVDILLDAYFAAFTNDDDVSLVLKTFPNPHNDVGAMLTEKRAAHPNPAHVVWIDREMADQEIDGLYASASAMAHPARGEGFGLTVAEAMRAGVPVIAPAATGMADFVDSDTATVIPHRLVPARTHVSIPGSMWEEPDADALAAAMRWHVDHLDSPETLRRVASAAALIAERFSWQANVDRWYGLIDLVKARKRAPRVAIVSTWNTRCGIAEYTASLVGLAGDAWRAEIHADRISSPLDPRMDESVVRDWVSSPFAPVDELIQHLQRSEADIVHIQHNFGFIGLSQLADLLRRLTPTVPIVLTLHRTEDLETPELTVRLSEFAADLALADRIIVHQAEDEQRLRDVGITRIDVIPIGAVEMATSLTAPIARGALGIRSDVGTFLVGTYGFLLPHKGTLELIRAVAMLRAQGHDVALLAVCALHNDPVSAHYERECLDEVHRLGLDDSIRLVTDYLHPDVSRLLLATADVIALPYHETSESSSASLRSVLPIGRPVIATDIAIFADARQSIVLVGGPPDEFAIAAAILDMMVDRVERERYGSLASLHAARSSLGRSVARHSAVYHDVLEARAHRGAVSLETVNAGERTSRPASDV